MDPEGDFGSPHETILTEQYDRPILVHRYPTVVKAFYMKEDPENPARALGVDVLAPEGYGEVIGGGEREDDLDVLLRKIKEHELPQDDFEWFLDLRRYGSVPHGGFGLGLEDRADIGQYRLGPDAFEQEELLAAGAVGDLCRQWARGVGARCLGVDIVAMREE